MAYITTEEVRAIRNKLKEVYGKKFKFGVRKESGGLAVAVTVLRGTVDFGNYLDANGVARVNPYYIDRHFEGEAADFLTNVLKIVKTAPAEIGGREWFDDSDSMIDYFNTAYYFHIGVGDYNKPYELVA